MGTLRTDLGGYAFRVRRARRQYTCWTCRGPIFTGMQYEDCGAGERRHVYCSGPTMPGETWILVGNDDLPERFGRECDPFRSICSNGFDGPLALESAFLHGPSAWPQCFPMGKDGDASCTNVTVKRVKL